MCKNLVLRSVHLICAVSPKGEYYMKPAYERENFTITEFDSEDVITTSGALPVDPTNPLSEKENAYGSFVDFDMPGSWF